MNMMSYEELQAQLAKLQDALKEAMSLAFELELDLHINMLFEDIEEKMKEAKDASQ